MDESRREELAEFGKRDLFFFARAICGYDWLTLPTHRALCEFIVQTDGKVSRRMLMMPRGHLKSTIFTVADTLRLLAINPEERILLLGAGDDTVTDFLRQIKKQILENDVLRWLYPHLHPSEAPDARWNNKEIDLVREGRWGEASITAKPVRSKIEGHHYTRIKGDDLIDEDVIRSDAEMYEVISRMEGIESLLVSETNPIDVIGNRKRLDDLYAWFEEFYGNEEPRREIGPYAYIRGGLAVFTRQALENGQPIFPYDGEKGYTNEFFERMARNAPERYHSQYANDPIAPGLTTFDVGDLQYFRWADTARKMLAVKKTLPNGEDIDDLIPVGSLDVIVVIDPSLAQTKQASRQAMLVLGQEQARKSRIFVLDTKIGHYTPTEMVETIFAWDKAWKPRIFSIEKYGYQGAIKYWLREKADRDMLPYPPVLEYPPKGSSSAKQAKDERIRGLQPLVSSHQMHILPSEQDLLEEFKRFVPEGRSKRDALDALAQCIDLFGLAVTDDWEAEVAKADEKILASLGPDGYSVREGSPLASAEMEDWERELVGGWR